jgi:hypothetical protein
MGSESVFLDSLWVNRGCVPWRIPSLPVKTVSRVVSVRAPTQFLVTVYESKGAVWAHESIRPLCKEFRGLYLNGQRVSFPSLFMSQKGLWGLTNSFVTCEKRFEGCFWVGSNLVFLDCLWVTRGCLGSRIHWPPVKAVSGAISEWEASQFSLTVYESTGAVGADESIRHMWKEFWGLLLSGQRLSFPRLFMSH